MVEEDAGVAYRLPHCGRQGPGEKKGKVGGCSHDEVIDKVHYVGEWEMVDSLTKTGGLENPGES